MIISATTAETFYGKTLLKNHPGNPYVEFGLIYDYPSNREEHQNLFGRKRIFDE
ncbi:MAG: hypothetical protein OEW75_17800 [Cyclobacteriaceae bacterium]|nr:hypothetical protein [Cyclobacteriaceae bacterium]